MLLIQPICAQDVPFSAQIHIELFPYEVSGQEKVSAMASLSADSPYWNVHRRFDYLILNTPRIHSPEQVEMRRTLFDLYPDTNLLKQLYIDQLSNDSKLQGYVRQTIEAIEKNTLKKSQTFSKYELLEVASRFFYCDKVNPDNSVQAHVCIGLNGQRESNWQKDYTLLEAFCYEAIFSNFDQETSQIDIAFSRNKAKVCQKNLRHFTSKNEYLITVREDLFRKMCKDKRLQKSLMNYYELHQDDLPFRLE
jgi:hypothetical protein